MDYQIKNPPTIQNGSRIEIGKNGRVLTIYVDHHFNFIQKFFIKWCFGFKIIDYSEKEEVY